jgi:protein TonB
MNTTATALRYPHHFPGRPRGSVTVAPVRPAPTGTWRYSAMPRRRWSYAAGLLLSVGLHTAIFFGFSRDAAPAPVAAKPQEQVVQMEMPPLPQEEPEQQPEELVEAQPVESVAVPQLMDVPQMVALSDFTQQVDLRPQVVDTNALRQMAIPVNHGRGGSGAGSFGNVFQLSDLDRIPQAMNQPAPSFPQNLPNDITEGRVVVTFIVDADGFVREPRVVESSRSEFERSALNGVMRWKFRPGMKGGRKVATRMEVPINFVFAD